jgi:hypothetical protein
MEQYAEAKVFFVESRPPVDPGVREQIESTAGAMAPARDAFLQEAIESVEWERRGFLRRLTARPVTR